MEKKMLRVLMVLCAVLALPLLIVAEENQPKKPHKPHTEKIAELDPSVKLAAVNKLRKEHKLAEVRKVVPSQVTLRPGAPSSGEGNYMVVTGAFGSEQGHAWIGMKFPQDITYLTFATISGKTYLLDVTLTGVPTWKYVFLAGGGVGGTGTLQQGHLLIPFVASGTGADISLAPGAQSLGPKGNPEWNTLQRAELTQVD
jgi:hypothetical protein